MDQIQLQADPAHISKSPVSDGKLHIDDQDHQEKYQADCCLGRQGDHRRRTISIVIAVSPDCVNRSIERRSKQQDRQDTENAGVSEQKPVDLLKTCI